jgi:hypothetical protein
LSIPPGQPLADFAEPVCPEARRLAARPIDKAIIARRQATADEFPRIGARVDVRAAWRGWNG